MSYDDLAFRDVRQYLIRMISHYVKYIQDVDPSKLSPGGAMFHYERCWHHLLALEDCFYGLQNLPKDEAVSFAVHYDSHYSTVLQRTREARLYYIEATGHEPPDDSWWKLTE